MADRFPSPFDIAACMYHTGIDPFTKKLVQSKSSYEHPQPHACFIQSVDDDLVNEGGIMDLWTREEIGRAHV